MNSKSVKEGGMKSMYSKSKRFIASFLAVLMAVCMLPADMLGAVGVAYAAAGDIKATLTVDDETVQGTEIAAGKTASVSLSIEEGSGSEDIYYLIKTSDNGDAYGAIAANTARAKDGEGNFTDGAIKFAAASPITFTDATEFRAFTTKTVTETIDEVETEVVKYDKVETFSYTFETSDPVDPVAPAAPTADKTSVKAGDTIILSSADATTIYYVTSEDEKYANVSTGAISADDLATVKGNMTAGTSVTVPETVTEADGFKIKAFAEKTENEKSAQSEVVELTFTVTAAKVTLTADMITVGGAAVTGESGSYTTTYKGKFAEGDADVEPEVKVTLEGQELTKGTDYSVSYANNTGVGTATVTVTAVDTTKITGSLTISFEIEAKQGGDEDEYPSNWHVLDFTKQPITGKGQISISDGYFTMIDDPNGAKKTEIKSQNVEVPAGVRLKGLTEGSQAINVVQTGGKTTCKTNSGAIIRFNPSSDSKIIVGALTSSSNAGKHVGIQKYVTTGANDTLSQQVELGMDFKEALIYYDNNDGEVAICTEASIMIAYVIVVEGDYIDQPIADPAGGKVNVDKEITLTSPDNVDIYWTYGTNAPAATDDKYSTDNKYSESNKPKITAEHTQVTAVAVLENTDGTVKKASQAKTFTYEITEEKMPEEVDLAVPVSTKSTGTYDAAQTITLSSDSKLEDDTPVAVDIYYTTDGTNPKTSATRNKATGDITVNETTVVKAYATYTKADGDINIYNDSGVATFRYIIKLASDAAPVTYTSNPTVDNEPFFDLDRTGNYDPTVPASYQEGDEYGVGTNDYFKFMNSNTKVALRDMTVLTDKDKLLGSTSTSLNYYNIENLKASWDASDLKTLVGELTNDVKAISICGGAPSKANGKVINVIRVDVSAPAEMVVYYSCKLPENKADGSKNTAGKIIVYNATDNDDDLGSSTENITITGNTGTYNHQIGKAEVKLAAAGSYYVGIDSQGGIIPYMSVTENKSTSTEDTVAITPTISAEELAKLDGATLYFTATGETDVPVTASGTAVQLKKGVTYSLVAKKDGTVVQTITAKINGNASYEVPNAAADITITVEVESLTASITPTISAEEAAKLDGAKVYFTATGEADEEVVSGTALQLKKGTTYTLVVKKDNVTDETMAAKINGSTEYAVTADATVEITIEAGLTPAERVAITPSISDDDLAKLDGAKVYFTAPGEKLEVTSGTAVNLKKEVKYTLVVEKDGTTVANTTAQIGASSEYTPTAATTVTITISVTQAPTKPAAPTATVNGHSVANNENVTVMEGATIALTSADSADIYYTDDNSTPDSTSTRYGSSFTVTATKTIKAVAIKDGLSSDVLTFTVTVNSYTYDDEGDEENEDNDWWTEDKDEIKEKNNGKIPAGLWIAGIYSEGYNYTGNKITPYVRVYHNVHLLTEKVDYTISYKNNVNVPTTDAANKQPTIVVKGKGNYVKQATETFKINPRSMGDDSVYIDDMTVLAKKNGGALKPVPTVILSYWVNEDVEKERKLKNKKEFDVKYCTEKEFQDAGYDLDKITGTDSVSAEGSYRIIVTGKGNYSGISSASLEVLKSDAILASKLKVKVGKIAYSKEEASKPGFDGFKPSVEVKAGRDTLTEGTDYTLEFYGNYEAGTARVLISALPKTSGEGENATETYAFYGTRTVTFTITGKPIKSAKVTVKPEALTYSYNYYDGIIGSSDITLEYKGTPMTLGEDYGISWIQNNWAAGKATIYIYGNGEYTGELKKVVKINPRDLSDSSISVTPETISGEFSKGGTRPAITVKYTFDEVAGYSYNLVEGRDYTVTYKSNNNFRKSPSLVIKGKGNFKGSITKTFTFDTKDISEVYFDVPNVVVNRGGKYGSKPVLSDRNGVKEVKLALKKDYTLAYYDMTEKANDPATEADGDTEEKEEGTPISNINKFTDGKAGSVIKVVATAVDGSGYTGKAVRYYTIRENDFSKVKIKVANKEFTGKAVTITADDITITGATLTLQENPDSETDGYYIDPASYVNNVKKGTAKVTLIGTGKYAGSKTVSFKITAKEVKWDRPTTN